MITLLLCLSILSTSFVQGLRLEAEDGILAGGVTFANSIPGYSGRGYVTTFQNDGSQVTVSGPASNGPYEVRVGYHSYWDKGFDFQVNDEKGSGTFLTTGGNNWTSTSAGKFLLKQTSNTITISKGWGYYELDYIDILPTTIEPPKKPPKKLSDPSATPETQSLFSFLVDFFGKQVLSGQYDFDDISYIKGLTGKVPAVGGFDLMDYSPSRVEHGANATGQVESEVSWALSVNSIVTLSWHWNAPCDLIDTPGKEWWRGFYTIATTYDISQALSNTSSIEYTKLIRDLDAIANQLVKFQNNKTPLLWRPLHEASGGWFWWGAKGSGPFKQLWRLMYNRFTQNHGLHHLIWVYTAAVGQNDWYPGDDVVDVVSLDIYSDPSASMSGEWEGILEEFNGKKLVTLSETGNLPVPDKIRGLGVWWSWFSVWAGMIKPEPVDTVKEVYSDPSIVTVDRLPDWRHYPL